MAAKKNAKQIISKLVRNEEESDTQKKKREIKWDQKNYTGNAKIL